MIRKSTDDLRRNKERRKRKRRRSSSQRSQPQRSQKIRVIGMWCIPASGKTSFVEEDVADVSVRLITWIQQEWIYLSTATIQLKDQIRNILMFAGTVGGEF